MPLYTTNGRRIGAYFPWEGVEQDYPLTIDVEQIVDDGNTLALSAGSPTVTQSQTIVANSASIALAAGTPKVVSDINALSASIALAAGTPKVIQNIQALSAPISLAAGTPTVTTLNTIAANSATISLAAGTLKVIQDINALSGTISLAAGMPYVFTPINALSATIALAAGTPTVTTLNTIVDDGNTISLAFGQPAVFTPINALSASIALAAGTPTVTALATIVDDGNTIDLTFGTPAVLASVQRIIDAHADIALAAGTPDVVQSVSALSAAISLAAGTPTVTTLNTIQALSASLALAAGTPTVTSQDTIVDDENDINLAAGTPTVTNLNTIVAISASIGLAAGTPTVKARNTIAATSAAVNLAAGQPQVKVTVHGASAPIAITAGAFTVVSPNQLILLGPNKANIGDPVLVASSKLADPSRDDDFVSSISPALWTTSSTGSTNVSVNNGVSLELRKVVGGSSYQLQSVAQYLSGDLSVDYKITSQFLSDLPTSEVVYAGLTMSFLTGQKLVLKRVMGPQGQQILAQYFVGGVFYGGAARKTTQSSGTLRLVKHVNIVAAVVDDDPTPLFYAVVNEVGYFRTQIFSTTNGQSQYIKAQYNTYRSHTGVLFGNVPLWDRTLETDARVEGTVPAQDTVGLVDVRLFNHNGQIGIAPGGFTYPLVLGQKLSSNKGFGVNIQSDRVIRS